MQIFKNPNFNFVRWRWHALALSCALIVAGVAYVWTRGLPLGVEFSGGSIVIVQFEEMPDIQRIRQVANAAVPSAREAIVQRYGDPGQNEVMIRVAEVGAEIEGQLSAAADQVVEGLREADLGAFQVIGTEIVGPVVGDQLKRQGTLAGVLALVGILIYIALRFKFSFAVGAVVATLHDLLITMAFLAFFQYDLSLNVIAALLTITGYSVNDTIVIFDRVRENMRAMRRDNLAHIVNVAVNQTLGRTVITAGTTLLAVTSLFVFGGEVLKGFAFTMLVGVIVGTYSSVFVAAAIVLLWQGRSAVRGQAGVGTEPAARRPTRRARAS